MNGFLTVLVIVNTLFFLAFTCVSLVIWRKYINFTRWLHWFTEPQDEKTPSPVQQRLELIATNMSRIMIAQAKLEASTTLAGMKSGEARGARAESLDGLAGSLPWWAQIGISLLGRKRASGILPMLMQAAQTPHSTAPQNNGSSKSDFGGF